MSEMFDEIFARRGEVRTAHDEDQARSDVLAREAAERAIREASSEEEYTAEATRMGRELAELLNSNGVPSMPILRRGPGLTTVERGQGWHVSTVQMYEGIEAPTSKMFIALTDDGQVGTYTIGAIRVGSGEGTILKGIYEPRLMYGARAHAEMSRENMKLGIASLLELGKPYEDKKVYS